MQEFDKHRTALGSYLKSISNKQIQEADEGQTLRWPQPVAGQPQQINFQGIVDQSWHDQLHIEDLRIFKSQTLALELKLQTEIDLLPTPPFNFDYTFWNPSHFQTLHVKWEPGVKWQTMRFQGRILGLKFINSSSPSQPKIRLQVYSDRSVSKELETKLIAELTWRYNLDLDLADFYSVASKHQLLNRLAKTYKGMRSFHSDSLYEYLMIGITLQNAPIHRTIRMMQNLMERLGEPVYFDNQYLYTFWQPETAINIDTETYKELKFGYRGKSIVETSRAYLKLQRPETSLRKLPIEELDELLQNLPGIGPATSEYILMDCFHYFAPIKRIPPWEAKLYSQIFFGSELPLPEKQLLNYLNQEFGEYVKLAIYYFWQDIWWRRERGEKIAWLEKEIRVSKAS